MPADLARHFEPDYRRNIEGTGAQAPLSAAAMHLLLYQNFGAGSTEVQRADSLRPIYFLGNRRTDISP